MLSLLTNTAIQIVLVLALWVVGQLCLQRLGRSGPAGRRDVPLALAVGVVVWSALLFALAALGLYRASVVAPLTAAAALFAAIRWLQQRRSTGRASRASSTSSAGDFRGTPDGEPRKALARLRRGASCLLLAAIWLVLAALWIQAHRPDVAHDAGVYHLRIPERLLAAGGFHEEPWNVYFHWPHAVQLVWGQALALGRHEGTNLLHWAFTVALLVAVARSVAAGRAATGPSGGEAAAATGAHRVAGVFAAILVLANPVVLFEARIPYVDLAYALLLFAAFLELERGLSAAAGGSDSGSGTAASFPRSSALLLGILLAGVATVKLNGFVGVAALLAVAVATRVRRHPPDLTATLLRIAVPIALLLGAWLAKSWWLTGNPVYPLLWEQFGGANWSAELADQHRQWNRSIGMGREPIDYLLLPWRLLTEAGLGYERFDGELTPLWWLGLPLALLACLRDPLARRAASVALLFFAGWALSSQQLRLLIPALPLVALAAGRGAALLLAERRLSLLAAPLALAATALLLADGWVYLRQAPRLAGDLVRGGAALREQVVPSWHEWVAEATPPDSLVLLLGTNRSYGVEREVAADSFFEASQISALFAAATDADEAAAVARGAGITHLLWTAPAQRFPYPPALVALAGERLASPACTVAADESAALLVVDC
ncbi:MAG: hypothetical protein DWQ36_15600 [Acidobacteria bacterium]|nr:MAG: hypothetical protein DWQ36_15600 [Acidobacteriota bacterium]